ncbi:MAG: hypothetical protein ACKVU1_08345 [bacterium]
MRSGAAVARAWAAGIAIGVVIGVFAPATARSAGPRMSAVATNDSARVGDPITVRFTLSAPVGSPLELPPVSKTLGEFEVLSWTPLKIVEKGGERIAAGDAHLAAWRTGVMEIPSVRAVGDTTQDVSSTPIPITIVSVGLDESGEARPVRGPVSLPRNWWLIALVTLGVIALGLAAFLLVRRLRRKPGEAPAPPVIVRPAHEVAYEELAKLASERLVDRGLAAEQIVRLADILRDYLGRRFGFNALDMTTAEIVTALRSVFEHEPRESRTAFSQAREFLEDGDLVKFADVVPEAAAASSGIARVRAIVDATRVPDAAPLAEAS